MRPRTTPDGLLIESRGGIAHVARLLNLRAKYMSAVARGKVGMSATRRALVEALPLADADKIRRAARSGVWTTERRAAMSATVKNSPAVIAARAAQRIQWAPEMTAELIQMRGEQRTVRECARRIGVCAEAITAEMRRIGLPGRLPRCGKHANRPAPIFLPALIRTRNRGDVCQTVGDRS